jgi:hypothetical protein
LQDYPFASERTKEYLKLLAENARLNVTVNKISEQLIETKSALTETEGELLRIKAELHVQASMRSIGGSEDHGNSRLIRDSGNSEAKVNPLQELFSKSEQVQELGSKFSQWVHSARKMSDDSTRAENTPVPVNNDDKKSEDSNMFDWKKIGRTALLERIKQSQTTTIAERPEKPNESVNKSIHEGNGDLSPDTGK